MNQSRPLSVPTKFWRGAYSSEQESIDSAVWLLQHMCEHLGLEDLRDVELLDYGCGVKFTQAILEHELPIKRYVGIDVYKEMIDFLRAHVHDPRFEFHDVDLHNALYNPGGTPLTADTCLPIGDRRFDVICLFSVFTHLAPDDYRALLQVLRRYAAPGGKLFFSVFLTTPSERGHGFVESFATAIVEHEDFQEKAIEVLSGHEPAIPWRFCDLDPSQPLKWALYTEDYARELIDGTGWEVLTLSPPDVYIQHHFVLAPV